jgi:hypothetical protein
MTDWAASPSAPDRSAAHESRRRARTAVFFAFAALVVLGPSVPQVLDIHLRLFRPWTMFSGVGVGILKGEFRAVTRDGAVTRYAPLQLLGRDRYPVMRSIHFPLRVMQDSDLRKFAAEFCARSDASLSFDGFVGTRQGWRALRADDICRWPLHDKAR